MRWPLAIAAGLLLVMLVNAAFLWVALSHADVVDPTYSSEHR